MSRVEQLLHNFLDPTKQYLMTQEDVEMLSTANPSEIFFEKTIEEIVAKHNLLVLKTHPDKNTDKTPEYQQLLSQVFCVLRKKYTEFFKASPVSTESDQKQPSTDAIPIEQKLLFDETIYNKDALLFYKDLSPAKIYAYILKHGCPVYLSVKGRQQCNMSIQYFNHYEIIDFVKSELSCDQTFAFLHALLPYDVVPITDCSLYLLQNDINKFFVFLKLTKANWKVENLFRLFEGYYHPFRHAFVLMFVDKIIDVCCSQTTSSFGLGDLIHFLLPVNFEEIFHDIKQKIAENFPIKQLPYFLREADSTTGRYSELAWRYNILRWKTCIPEQFAIPDQAENAKSSDRIRALIIESLEERIIAFFSESMSQLPDRSKTALVVSSKESTLKSKVPPIFEFLERIEPKYLMEIIERIPTIFSMLYQSELAPATYLPKIDFDRMTQNQVAAMYCCFASKLLSHSNSAATTGLVSRIWTSCYYNDAAFINRLRKISESDEPDLVRANHIRALCEEQKSKLSTAMNQKITDFSLLTIPLKMENALSAVMEQQPV